MSDAHDSASATARPSADSSSTAAPAPAAEAATPGSEVSTWTNAFPSIRLRQRSIMTWLLVTMLGILAIEWLLIARRRPEELPITRGSSFEMDFRVDVNSATWIEWSQLPGIGPSLAHRIVAYRRVNGPFRVIDDLELVPGIGQAKLDAIRHQLTIRHENSDLQHDGSSHFEPGSTSSEAKQPTAIQ